MTNSQTKSKLKIGDKLYRYTGTSIMSYEVYGVVKRDVGTLYEIRCLDCRDHPDCEILIAESKDGYVFVDMINQDDQDIWHRTSDAYHRYERTKNLAVKNRKRWTIDYIKKQIRQSKDSIEKNEERVKELETDIEALEEQL